MSAPDIMTFDELAERYFAVYQGRDRTRRSTLCYWRALYGTRAFASLTDDDVFHGLERLRNDLKRVYAGRDAEGRRVYRGRGRRAPATVNRYHAALMALLTFAIKRRLAPKGWENPARKVERTPERNERVRCLQADERTRLFEACRRSGWPRLYVLVLLAITTGARRGELAALTWGDVDLERGLAFVRTTKNGEPRVLPLTEHVRGELRRFGPAERAEICVFPARGAKGLYLPRNFESSWQAALKAAGIKNFRFHDLRHSCASYLAQTGASLLEIADVLGHKTLAMTRRYSHLSSDSKEKLVNRVLGGIK